MQPLQTMICSGSGNGRKWKSVCFSSASAQSWRNSGRHVRNAGPNAGRARRQSRETVADALATCRNHLDSLPDMTPEKLEARRAELDEIIRHVQERQAILRSRPANVYLQSLRILRGNPTATVREDFKEALETLRKLK